MTTAAICTIGDEILIGQIVDTNSSHIARELNKLGIKVDRMTSISDRLEDIEGHLSALLDSFDIVIVTGGLGPTKDDVTKTALMRLSSSDSWKMNNEQLEVVKRVLTVRGIELSEININQALVPSKCEVIVNRLGTAPCIVTQVGNSRLYNLPGVPFEALSLLPDIMQDIRSHFSLEHIEHKTITTFGIPESMLAAKIASWEDSLPCDMKLAYLPNALNGVKLRLSIYGAGENGMKRIDEEFAKILPLLADAVYGEGEDTLTIAIARILMANGKTIGVAESCTGGRIASLFTANSGSSKYFIGSVTSYSNEVKKSLLNVSDEILSNYGAVSSECAKAMALGAKNALGCDFALSTTGIAGPDGGSDEKPVGTVWVAVAYKDNNLGKDVAETIRFNFSSNRATNIERFAANALNFLRKKLIEQLHPKL